MTGVLSQGLRSIVSQTFKKFYGKHVDQVEQYKRDPYKTSTDTVNQSNLLCDPFFPLVTKTDISKDLW